MSPRMIFIACRGEQSKVGWPERLHFPASALRAYRMPYIPKLFRQYHLLGMSVVVYVCIDVVVVVVYHIYNAIDF